MDHSIYRYPATGEIERINSVLLQTVKELDLGAYIHPVNVPEALRSIIASSGFTRDFLRETQLEPEKLDQTFLKAKDNQQISSEVRITYEKITHVSSSRIDSSISRDIERFYMDPLDQYLLRMQLELDSGLFMPQSVAKLLCNHRALRGYLNTSPNDVTLGWLGPHFMQAKKDQKNFARFWDLTARRIGSFSLGRVKIRAI